MTTSLPVLRTKLYQPPVPDDLVLRLRLLEKLERQRQRPLSLISAPAGYGKSTLVSNWLKTCNVPSAWLSLDDRDNDLAFFMYASLAAIQTQFPAIGGTTLALLKNADLPPVRTLAVTLINELD